MDRPMHAMLGGRLPSWLPDAGPAALALVAGAAALANRGEAPAELVAALVLSTAALVARRRAPLLVLGIVLALMLALDAGAVTIIPALVALATVAEYRDRLALAGAAVATAAAVVGVQPLHGGAQGLSAVLAKLLAVGLPVAIGLYLRARADYVGALRERAERLERERDLLARQAAAEERVRIARELHDVVSHSVSLMVVQAQALAATGAGGEERVALGRLADLGREALAEMHRMLGVLRLREDDAPERAPQPGVGALGDLLAQLRHADLEVDLRVEGPPRELEPAVDLSAYRIVQEALTNVVRHADARHVAVVLRYRPRELHVTVTDDGAGPARAGATAGGHGLVGMRERVALFGGELQAGVRRGGRGFRVHAALPTR